MTTAGYGDCWFYGIADCHFCFIGTLFEESLIPSQSRFFLFWNCWLVGGHPACKILGVVLVLDDLTGALHVLQLQLSPPCIILSSNKMQNGDILVPANPGPLGIMAYLLQVTLGHTKTNEPMDDIWSEVSYMKKKKKKKISHRTEVRCVGAHPPFWPLEPARVKPN